MKESVYRSEFFKGLDAAEIEEAMSKIRYQVKKYSTGNYIFYSGERSDSLNIIIEGSVRGEMVDFKGAVIKMEDIFAPDAFAPAYLFASENVILVDVVANTDTEVLVIYKEDLLKLFQVNRQILQNYLQMISNKFVLMTRKMKFLTLKTIRGKIAHYLLNREKRMQQNKKVRFLRSQEQLAEYFGVTRPALARELKKMENEGIIALERKQITIVDRERLLTLLE